MNIDSKFIHLLRLTTVILFFFILWIPIIQMVYPILPEMKSTENRQLAEKPKIKFSLKALKNYAKRYNMYLNDHYGLRNFIIRVNCRIHINLLHTSPKRDVVLGREGWLYYDNNNDGNNLKDFYGESNFTKADLDKIVEKIIKIKTYCSERNILFRIVFAPNKHTIYPEFLPPEIMERRGLSTRLDQLMDYLNRNQMGATIIDLRPVLISSKNTFPFPLYYRIDMHWNRLGAFIAYAEIMKNLRLNYPQIKILDIKNYRFVMKEKKEGDLADFISVSGLLKDQEVILEPPVPSLTKKTDPNIRLENVGIEISRYHAENCNYLKLLMFRDSFAVGLLPYFSESFSDSLYIWTYKWLDVYFSIIEKERPHMVILELAERFVSNLTS